MRFLLILIALVLIPVAVCASPIDTTVIARGDSITVDAGQDIATVWIFSTTGLDHLYDVGTTKNVDGDNIITITQDQSQALHAGEYTIVKQYIGMNFIKEVSYEKKYNASQMLNEYLTSPYKSVADVSINGLQPHMVKDVLYGMVANGTDDILVSSNLTVEEPNTYTSNVYELNPNQIYIGGISNLHIGTDLTIVWDADRQTSQQDYRLNTYYTTVYQGNTSINDRRWNITANASVQNLPPGNHFIDITANGKTTRVGYDVGEVWNTDPVPTYKLRYLSDGTVVTPAPVTIEVPVIQEVTREVTKIIVQPSPSFPRDALGREYNPFTVPDTKGYIVPVIGVLVALIALRRSV